MRAVSVFFQSVPADRWAAWPWQSPAPGGVRRIPWRRRRPRRGGGRGGRTCVGGRCERMYFFDKGAKLEIQFTKGGGKARWAAARVLFIRARKKRAEVPFSPLLLSSLLFSHAQRDPSFLLLPIPPFFLPWPPGVMQKNPVASLRHTASQKRERGSEECDLCMCMYRV